MRIFPQTSSSRYVLPLRVTFIAIQPFLCGRNQQSILLRVGFESRWGRQSMDKIRLANPTGSAALHTAARHLPAPLRGSALRAGCEGLSARELGASGTAASNR
jgi:hypothetical protein